MSNFDLGFCTPNGTDAKMANNRKLILTIKNFKTVPQMEEKAIMDIHQLETLGLVEGLYSAAVNGSSWLEVTDAIAERFNSHAAGIFMQRVDGSLSFSSIPGMSEAFLSQYNEHFGAINPWFTTPGMMTQGRVLTDLTFEQEYNLPARHFRESEFFQDWCRPQKFHHAIGGQLKSIDSQSLNFSLLRDEHAGAFTEAETRLYAFLTSNMLNALEIAQSVAVYRQAHGTMEEAFTAIGQGFAAMDESYRLQRENVIFNNVINCIDGISVKGHQLEFHNEALKNQFDSLVRRCLKYTIPQSLRLYLGRQQVEIKMIPSTDVMQIFNLSSRLITVLVNIDDYGLQNDIEINAERYRLTPREAQIVKMLLRGASLKAISEQLDFSYETSRWHMKNIMTKTGAKTQNELICIIRNLLDHSLSKP